MNWSLTFSNYCDANVTEHVQQNMTKNDKFVAIRCALSRSKYTEIRFRFFKRNFHFPAVAMLRWRRRPCWDKSAVDLCLAVCSSHVHLSPSHHIWWESNTQQQQSAGGHHRTSPAVVLTPQPPQALSVRTAPTCCFQQLRRHHDNQHHQVFYNSQFTTEVTTEISKKVSK